MGHTLARRAVPGWCQSAARARANVPARRPAAGRESACGTGHERARRGCWSRRLVRGCLPRPGVGALAHRPRAPERPPPGGPAAGVGVIALLVGAASPLARCRRRPGRRLRAGQLGRGPVARRLAPARASPTSPRRSWSPPCCAASSGAGSATSTTSGGCSAIARRRARSWPRLGIAAVYAGLLDGAFWRTLGLIAALPRGLGAAARPAGAASGWTARPGARPSSWPRRCCCPGRGHAAHLRRRDPPDPGLRAAAAARVGGRPLRRPGRRDRAGALRRRRVAVHPTAWGPFAEVGAQSPRSSTQLRPALPDLPGPDRPAAGRGDAAARAGGHAGSAPASASSGATSPSRGSRSSLVSLRGRRAGLRATATPPPRDPAAVRPDASWSGHPVADLLRRPGALLRGRSRRSSTGRTAGGPVPSASSAQPRDPSRRHPVAARAATRTARSSPCTWSTSPSPTSCRSGSRPSATTPAR